MDFEYNGNLEENERILQVAKEIIDYYPEIEFEKAKTIASLEDPITTEIDSIMYFKRLYNILFVNQNDVSFFSKVYSDIIKIYNLYLTQNIQDDKLDSMMEELTKYANKERTDFPIISEFY